MTNILVKIKGKILTLIPTLEFICFTFKRYYYGTLTKSNPNLSNFIRFLRR
jgi:hypothetical protein